MTTVACDGKMIAGDSQVGLAFISPGSHKKIFRLKNGDLIGFSGQVRCWIPTVKYLNNGDKFEIKEPEFSGLILKTTGQIMLLNYDLSQEECYFMYAIGSGAEFAMGAMMAGCSAYESVKIASKLDPSTGGKVRYLKRKE